MLAFSHFYRLNTLILGQFPCFSGIFHIKPFDRPIFLNYPENLQQPTTDLPDEETPMAEAPKTGDNSTAWVLAAGVSGLALVWLAITGKKRRDNEHQA